MENKFFNKALSKFIQNTASGDAVRHLANRGYTVDRIVKEISYPTSKAQVAKIVWQHYVDEGIILLEKPTEEPTIKKVSYVRKYGKYGTIHFKQVVEQIENPQRKYYPCDFGKKIYQDEEKFLKSLENLWESDKEYILGLPWPLQTVYHAADERMDRIMNIINC